MYKIQTCFEISKLIFTQQQNILLRFNTGSRFTVQFDKKKICNKIVPPSGLIPQKVIHDYQAFFSVDTLGCIYFCYL